VPPDSQSPWLSGRLHWRLHVPKPMELYTSWITGLEVTCSGVDMAIAALSQAASARSTLHTKLDCCPKGRALLENKCGLGPHGKGMQRDYFKGLSTWLTTETGAVRPPASAPHSHRGRASVYCTGHPHRSLRALAQSPCVDERPVHHHGAPCLRGCANC